ncbi:hypothetical protein LJC59_09710 [Desulfovibrio sp. OttesenSCG-928-A18]|nr:hypothetical protein [Desulfovibrio sp. OttesenSCG-928-A18]
MALEGTTAILETQLLQKEELYKRWFGATHEEIARHFTVGELRVYERHKGPINGIIWCKPGHVYYQSQVSYSNPDLYDYNDDSCDYFLLEDVMRCETEHPEYTGNVTPESLGLIQDGESGAPEEEPEYIKAESWRKEMMLSPVQFVDYLESHKRRIAEATSISPFPVAGSDASPMADIPFPTVAIDSSGLESQLAEAQKKIEDVEGVRRWNKQFLTERAELQSSLAEKDTRIAELEAELVKALAQIRKLENKSSQRYHEIEVPMTRGEIEDLDSAAIKLGLSLNETVVRCLETSLPLFEEHPELIHVAERIISDRGLIALRGESPKTMQNQSAAAATTIKRDTSAATIGKLRKDLESWKGALPMAVYATLAVLEDGEKLRSRKELRAICEACKASFSGVQFEAWRAVLPEGYFDKDDRSADPQNTVEDVAGEE